MSEALLFADIAANIEGNPKRAAEARAYHHALLAAMNATHTDFEQDALCVFEGVARLLSQMIGELDAAEARGCLAYVTARALHHRLEARALGSTATILVEGSDGEVVASRHSGRPQ